MRVKMLTLECGPDGNYAPGEEREVSDEHGRRLIAGRHAVDITLRTPQAALLPGSEKAMMPSPAARRGRAKQ